MKKAIAHLLVLSIIAVGCGGGTEEPAQPTESEPQEAAAPLPEPNYDIPMRNFAPAKIGPYDVQPMFEEEIVDGHFNIKVTGEEFEAVRIWVGKEDPADVMVVKCELENDYQHGHLEVPDPVPADYALWIEIEDTEGNLHKGSTPLKHAE